MALEFVDVMSEEPGHCTLCHGTPTDMDGHPLPSIHVPGLDVNWGESVYICLECAGVIADLIERVDEEEHRALQKEYQQISKEYAKVRRAYAKVSKRLKAIVAGEKAKKEVKSGS